MKVSLISPNYSPELTGVGKYNAELVNYLSKDKDVGCLVLTAPPYYPGWSVFEGYSNWFSVSHESNKLIQRCPLYVPSRLSTLRRIIHLFSFSLSLLFGVLRNIRFRTNCVIVVQPTLFSFPVAWLYAKLARAKLLIHIQDYEIDAMLGISDSGCGSIVSKAALSVERYIYRQCDVVSSISQSMLKKAISKGVDPGKLLFFPNWSDTKFVSPEVSGEDLKLEWGYSPGDKVVLYSGNIGKKQGLEMVLYAAAQFKNSPNVKFLIVGDGAYRAELIELAQELQLNNIEFKGLVEWALVPQLLNMAAVHLVVQKSGVADAVLPSKLTNILSCGGNALVTAERDTELGQIEQKYPGIYKRVEPENLQAYVEGLRYCLAQDTATYNPIARAYAEKYIEKENVLNQFYSDLENLVGKN